MRRSRRDRWIRIVALGTIYFVWGSTFLAIKVGVAIIPPALFAALRFLVAGLVLVVWVSLLGERLPRGREWNSILLLGSLFFLIDYGLLFWAEQRLASGIAAVILATIPLFMATCEATILKTLQFSGKLAAGLFAGTAGVVTLASQSFHGSRGSMDGSACGALVLASASWAVGSVLSRRLPLPPSQGMAAGTQMLVGGSLLMVLSGVLGNLRGFHPTKVPESVWFSLLYLILPGSVLGFTAYLWLIQHESPTKVGTYAYVNPMVAVMIGYFFAGERVGPVTAAGSCLIVLSVALVTWAREGAVVSARQSNTAS